MIPILEPRECVYFNAASWTSFIQKITQQGALVTPLEHNSAMIGLGRLMDVLSDPNVAKASSAPNGLGYLWETYYGSEAAYQAKRIPVVGAMVAPSDATRLTWWQAWQEITDRLGSRYTTQTTTAWPTVDLTAQQYVATDGVVSRSVLPLRQIPAANTLWIKEDPDVIQYFGTLLGATSMFALRLLNIANGSTDSSNLTVSTQEAAASSQITAISNLYLSERTHWKYLGAGGVAGALVLEALAKLAMGKKSYRRSRR